MMNFKRIMNSHRTLSMSLIAFMAAALSGLAACARFSGYTPEKRPTATAFTDEKAKQNEILSADQSDSLTDEGEALLDAMKLNEALGRFQRALQADPKNQRAKFWAATLKPLLEIRGIRKRTRPLYAKTLAGLERYENMRNKTAQSFNPQIANFLDDGPEDLNTPAEVQEWLDRLRDSVAEFRATIRSLRDSELTVQLPSALTSSWNQSNSREDCRTKSFGPVKFNGIESTCGSGAARTVGLNRADFEMILTQAATFQAHLEFWTAYRLNPVVLPKLADIKVQTREDAQRVLREIFGDAGGGKLRQKSPFKGARDITSDLVAGLRYVLEHQQELCPRGLVSIENRKGYLLAGGHCVFYSYDNSVEPPEVRDLKFFETLLAGEPIPLVDPEGKPRGQAQALKFLEHPLDDLQKLTPVAFNQCGSLTSVNSEPLSGYLNGVDIDRYLNERLAEPGRECSSGGRQ